MSTSCMCSCRFEDDNIDSDIFYRSFLRTVAEFCLESVQPRCLHLHPALLENFKCEDDDEVVPEPRGVFDILDEELFEDGIIHRFQLHPPGTELSSIFGNDSSMADSSKMSEMEDEIAKLRKQIALIVMQQEMGHNGITPETETFSTCLPPSPPITPIFPVSLARTLSTPLSFESDNNSTVGASAPLSIPPPPPPPPPVYQPPTLKFSKKSKSDLMKPQPSEDNSVPDLREVLKDMGNVKLRSVARSPGGTPLRQAPLLDPNDPVNIIAQALKRKFAHVRSPVVSDENCSPSPKMQFGQHLLKNTGRTFT